MNSPLQGGTPALPRPFEAQDELKFGGFHGAEDAALKGRRYI